MADAITLQVEGMSCGHCIRAVTTAITALDGAANVAVDLAAKRVVAQTKLPRAEVQAKSRAYATEQIAQQMGDFKRLCVLAEWARETREKVARVAGVFEEPKP